MEEDEAALLAELRAISSAAASASRFDDDGTTVASDQVAMPPTPSSRRQQQRQSGYRNDNDVDDDDDDPVSQRRRQSGLDDDDDDDDPVSQRRHQANVSDVESQGSFSHMSISSLGQQQQQQQFADESRSRTQPWQHRTHHAAISSNHQHPDEDENQVLPSSSTTTAQESPPILPGTATVPTMDRVVGADEQTTARPFRLPRPPSSNKQNHNDNRGGPAQDAELIAELRNISSQSSAADRFASVEEQQDKAETTESPHPVSPKHPLQQRLQRAKRNIGTPPWKRKPKVTTPTTQEEDDIVVEVAVPPNTSVPVEPDSNNDDNDDIVAASRRQEEKEEEQTTPRTFPKSNFTGERGGAAEDAELLAELRNISSQSSAADRFAGSTHDGDDDDKSLNHTAPETHVTVEPTTPKTEEKQTLRTKVENLPPWKRRRAHVTAKSPSRPDITVAVPTKKEIEKDNDKPWKQPKKQPQLAATVNDTDISYAVTAPKLGIKSDLPSAFHGERGGTAEDPELLALLRGVSNKSGATDRFGDNDNDVNIISLEAPKVPTPPTPPTPARTKNYEPEPKMEVEKPWKQKRTTAATDTVEVTVVAPTPKYGIKSETASSFQGERGGAAEDAELLALLRGVSNKSGAADRFADDENGKLAEALPQPTQPEAKPKLVSLNAISTKKAEPDKPWKQKRKSQQAPPNDNDVMIAVPESKYGIKSEVPSTFVGERGGAAEDTELLALLRGVSNKSGATDRFAEDSGAGGSTDLPSQPQKATVHEPKPSHTITQKEQGKPWEQKAQVEISESIDVVVAVSKSKPMDESVGFGIKSDVPSSFQGERGGVAQDEELLAELRAISTKSSGDRFANSGHDKSSLSEEPRPKSPVVASPKVRIHDGLPPWKRKKAANAVEPKVEIAVPDENKTTISDTAEEVSSPIQRRRSGLPSHNHSPRTSPQVRNTGSSEHQEDDLPTVSFSDERQSFGIKSDVPSTFSGERGGSAEDAELLALLRGVSNKSGASDRFADSNQEGQQDSISADMPSAPKPASLPLASPSARPSSTVSSLAPLPPGTPATNVGDMSREDLSDALEDKNWKVRSTAFVFLKNLLFEASGGPNSDMRGRIQGNEIMPGLDDRVPGFLEESNANALDKAVDFTVHYADLCQGASSAERARRIALSLVKKNALSGKVSTAQTASEIGLKLIEVGENGIESAHAVINAFIEQGLTSKKVKVVQASASLICEAAIEFGAAMLPLESVIQCIPQMMSHSNPKVRESGLALLAEMCRGLGSRDPVQPVIDGMRPAQVSELDAMLTKKSNSDPPRRLLRAFQGHGSGGQAELAAMAAAGAEELKAKQFAARPAIALMEVLPTTEYSSKLKLAKWSEKVAGMEIALSAGGEQPYKLAPPSSSNNYVPLITDMKGLLSHTHFAVNSKAMQVLSMLAEGVGEKLFPNLRPLLPRLLEMSKDKKLTKAIASCADSFFGNIVGFEHILEPDTLPYLVDEKKSKNAVARASALEFLARCVTRGASAGPRGEFKPSSVAGVGKLVVEKLSDSDAGVRNAATKVLQSMNEVEAEDVKVEVDKILGELKSTNARAYKSIAKSDSGTSSVAHSKTRTSIPKASSPPAKAPKSARADKMDKSAENVSRDAPPTPNTSSLHSTVAYPSYGEESDLAEALAVASSLRIPSWDSIEDDGGVLAGLKSSKWIQKQSAIKSIIAFIESDIKTQSANGSETRISALLQVVKEYTRGFKETNINIMKSILQLLSTTCDYHFAAEKTLAHWIVEDCVSVALQKISDKKLMDTCKELLTSACTVTNPATVLSKCCISIQSIRSPVVHEEFMKWCNGYCENFGAASLGNTFQDVASVFLADAVSTNPKVKRETLSALREFYRHVGPRFRAILLSFAKNSTERDEIDRCLQMAEYDPSLQAKGALKHSVASVHAKDGAGGQDEFSLPRFDLLSAVPKDVIQKMNTKDGKTAWKMRKEALDAVDDAITKCAGLIDSTSAKPLVELTRSLRDRLSDTQMNLKPLAAKAIGKLLGNIDPVAQARLGKIVYAPLLSAAMNDIKKPMREASLESINQIIRSPEIEGGIVNHGAIEGLVTGLVSEISEVAVKSIGLANVLQFLQSLVGDFPNLDEIAASRGESLGEQYAAVLIECLISSKSETRSESTSLVKLYANKGVISSTTFRRVSEKLKPAKQRSIKPILENLTGSSNASPEKENHSTSYRSQPGEVEESNSQHTPGAVKGKDGSRFRWSHTESLRSDTEPNELQAPMTRNKKTDLGDKSGIQDNGDAEGSHPLVTKVATRSQPRSITWPEYPEEPVGPAMFSNLKKAWSVFLPQTSVMKLFPTTGIKKQDDAQEGCELLSSAIMLDRSRDDPMVIEQLPYVLKWICFVLCSKEATVGLQALLGLVQELFNFLVENGRELDDAECLILIPFIIEKAGSAKGRFRDSLLEIVGVLRTHELVPAKRLGPIGCVSVIERSGHAKARLLAYQMCLRCIESAGLTGIGKKGVVATAKVLSEDHIPENKSAILDLLESILERMGGDMQKFVRICGPGFDGKSRELLEERWQKKDRTQFQAAQRTQPEPQIQPRVTEITPRQKFKAVSTSSQYQPDTPESKTVVLDELPALSLRETAFASKPNRKSGNSRHDLGGSNASLREVDGSKSALSIGSFGGSFSSLPASSVLLRHESTEDSKSDGVGTAALLRARLLKLKEKTIESFDEDSPLTTPKVFETAEEEFEHTLTVLQNIFEGPTPIADYDPSMISAAEVLKRLHAALSQQQSGGEDLRNIIISRLPETMEYLTR